MSPVVITPRIKAEIVERVGDINTKTPSELDAIAADYALQLPELRGLITANDRAAADARLRNAAAPAKQTPAPQGPVSTVTTDVPGRPDPDGAKPLLSALLDEADASDLARHRRKAEKIRTLIADLKADLETDREHRKAQIAAGAEVKRLQDELAAAKERLRSAAGTETKSAGNAGASAADIRAWAAENNVECPRSGQVPKSVRQAYETAQEAS